MHRLDLSTMVAPHDTRAMGRLVSVLVAVLLRGPLLLGTLLFGPLLFGLVACAPRLQPAGPPVVPPHVSDDVVTAPDGAKLPLRSWLPQGVARKSPAAVVLALHGFNDYSNAFDDAGRAWAEHGIATYAYDQRGFGGAPHRGYWAGTEAYVEDLKLTAALLRRRHAGVPFYILGESMGGAVVMVAMSSTEPPPADGVILVAPAVWGRGFMPWYQTISLWFSAHTMPWMQLTGEGLKIRPSDNIEMLRKFSADPMVIKATRIDAVHGLVDLMDAAQDAAPRFNAPSLILYGMNDEVVPDDPTFAMIKRLPRPTPARHRIALYQHGFHMLLRDLQAARVIEDVRAWIEQPDRPLPSGADALARKALGAGGGPQMDDKTRAPGLLPGVERP